MGRRRLVVMMAVVGLGALAVSWAPAAPLHLSACRVIILRHYFTSYSTLADAVAQANTGDTLIVSGRCIGTTTVDKDLTISGLLRGVLDGGGSGPVLTVQSGATVTLRALTITNGNTVNKFSGGGIYNAGTLAVTFSSISGNSATGANNDGGGIYNAGSLTIDRSSVSGNTATDRNAGGIFNLNTASLTLNHSSISHNSGSDGGGIGNFGSAILTDSWVSDNTGGGIYVFRGSVTLNGSSSVSGNTALVGGGIYNISGSVTLNDSSSVSGNTALVGGGIFNSNGSVTLNDYSSIRGNASTNDGSSVLYGDAGGGGIFSAGSMTLNGSSISYNTSAAGSHGGGIYSVSGTLNNAGAGGNVHNNTPEDIIYL